MSTMPEVALHFDIIADRRLIDFDIRVMLALLFAAGDRSYCQPTVPEIAGMVHRSKSSVQRSLGRLEQCGYIRFEEDDQHKTGRRIHLPWSLAAHEGR